MGKVSYEKMMKFIRFDDYLSIVKSEEIFKLGVETKWSQIIKDVGNDDPCDIYCNELEELQMMLYRNKLMNICELCEYWEQDIYSFLKEYKNYLATDNNYSSTKDYFEKCFPKSKFSLFPKIGEMRDLVNAIKHGEGRSLTSVKKATNDTILKDAFMVENNDGTLLHKKKIDFSPNTLIDETLNVDGKLKEYYDEIVSFWKSVYSELEDKKICR